MFATGFRFLARAAAGAVVAGLMFTTLATTGAKAATVDEFLANPTQVMAQYPNGGSELISLIRDVIVAHPDALKTVVGLLANANADQQSAIGSGAGQANRIVNNTDQNFANAIAVAIAGSGSSDAQSAYSGATGDVSIAATGPGGGGGGGGSGGTAGGSGFGGIPTGGSNSSSGGTTGQGSTQTSGNTFTGGGGGVSGSTSSGSVSPR